MLKGALMLWRAVYWIDDQMLIVFLVFHGVGVTSCPGYIYGMISLSMHVDLICPVNYFFCIYHVKIK